MAKINKSWSLEVETDRQLLYDCFIQGMRVIFCLSITDKAQLSAIRGDESKELLNFPLLHKCLTYYLSSPSKPE